MRAVEGIELEFRYRRLGKSRKEAMIKPLKEVFEAEVGCYLLIFMAGL